MVPVCDKRYHIYNRFRHFWAEIKKLWNYPLIIDVYKYLEFPVCFAVTKHSEEINGLLARELVVMVTVHGLELCPHVNR